MKSQIEFLPILEVISERDSEETSFFTKCYGSGVIAFIHDESYILTGGKEDIEGFVELLTRTRGG